MPAARYQRIVDAFTTEIRAGRLSSGTQLPTHRQLAAQEGIAVVTASRVYAELEAIGLVSSEQGRGTFVRELALPPGHGIDQQVLAADTIDLNFNYPTLPGQADLLRRALRELAGSGDLDPLLRYQPHGGRERDRAAVATHLLNRGLDVTPDRIAVVNGAQHGLTVAALAALHPGDVVAVDAVTYPGFKVLAAALRLELAPIPTRLAGPDLDALQSLCRRRPVRAVYTMPTLHNPLGWVMNNDDRRSLIAIARRHGLLLIEDGSYAYLVDHPPPPLAATAPDITVYASGLSKSVATGLRVGFLVAPPTHLSAIERAIRATTWNTPAITAAIATRWLEDGTVAHLEAEKRADATLRQTIARDTLKPLSQLTHPASYFTWLPLPESARADRIAATLATQRISVSTAEPFAITTNPPQALRLALGSANLNVLADALTTVRNTVEHDAHQ
ncbi:transcriptional regulator [Mycolicibacterium canariasense]|uniref:Transcriptional regulator n=1 Tax=Mycolicibacterium canariasense TaxID=228230 RepID=A0A100W904_MYCCR|nr:PLP-dependent aminotransferase family protein [Mycolicibacterium canariasense]MCV7212846.1 PLP-dependent aminotransferase family protein [Mycolicibacterium canariasense]ORV12569.1 GntR family transcriptional regulator [Mycolicibacterium canariasense]GAS93818.1 transcriptional regulator [Mycolicibacterium canariasense]